MNDEYMLLHQISYFNWTKILIIDMLLLSRQFVFISDIQC